jgi:hypothetical protein
MAGCGLALATKTQFPLPKLLKRRTSPATTDRFVAFGSAMALELVMVQEPVKRHSLMMPAATVPREVIVAEPVIYTDSASADPRSTVEAAASVAEARALVERIMEKPALK